MSQKVKLTHLITGLSTGGAEMMLYKLLAGMDRGTFKARVISLMDIGPVGEKIQALGVPVRALCMYRGVPDPRALWRLTRWLNEDKPDVLQTWMYHADLIGGLAARLAGGIPVVWNIRHSNLDPRGNKRTTLWTAKACALLSHRLPVRILCCAEASRKVHAALGYASRKMVVIPNGFDLAAFQPNPDARESVRRELGIPDNALVIGLVGRFDPQKDHRNFVQAAARLAERLDVHFLLCGNGVTWDNPDLTGWIRDAGIGDRCHLLGLRDDVPRLTAALDIASSSSSYGEAFSNVIGEAMACGLPCTVTDVGDSAMIVGDTGRVVPPRNPEVMAAAWQELFELGLEGRRRLGAAARQRVEANFSLPIIIARYESLYKEVLCHEGLAVRTEL